MQFDQYLRDGAETGLEQYTTLQNQVLEANKTLAETVGKALPSTPAFASMAGMPDASALIEGSFAAASSVLAANQKFVTDLAAIWAPAPAEQH